MQVRQAVHDVVKEPHRHVLPDAGVADDVVKQLPRVDVLHHQEDLLRRVDDLKQLELDDVGMSQALEDLDFPRHPLRIRNLLDPRLLQYLHRHLLLGGQVDAQLDLAKRALPQGLLHEVIPHHHARTGRPCRAMA